MFRSILVPYDSSPASITALEVAVEMAAAGAGSVTALVADEPVVDWAAAGFAVPGAAGALLDARESTAKSCLADAEARIPEGIRHRVVLGHGRPADSVLAELVTGHQDVVVIGNRGHGNAGALILGSVSHDVVRRSPVPVLVVRADMRTRAADGDASTVSDPAEAMAG